MTSNHTSPTNDSADPFEVGRFDWISTSLLRVYPDLDLDSAQLCL